LQSRFAMKGRGVSR